ncbi:hypothetical protein SUGI_0754640 [Cryptomeria japonica]|nr:hypothetical protein SUGI_0754640 [Cryptomeria japonica]
MKQCAWTMVFISGLRPLLAADQPGFAPMDAYAASSVAKYPAAAACNMLGSRWFRVG